jgi:hypothetical protein
LTTASKTGSDGYRPPRQAAADDEEGQRAVDS